MASITMNREQAGALERFFGGYRDRLVLVAQQPNGKGISFLYRQRPFAWACVCAVVSLADVEALIVEADASGGQLAIEAYVCDRATEIIRMKTGKHKSRNCGIWQFSEERGNDRSVQGTHPQRRRPDRIPVRFHHAKRRHSMGLTFQMAFEAAVGYFPYVVQPWTKDSYTEDAPIMRSEWMRVTNMNGVMSALK